MKRAYIKPTLVLVMTATQQPLATSGETPGPSANDQQDPTPPQKARANYNVWEDGKCEEEQ